MGSDSSIGTWLGALLVGAGATTILVGGWWLGHWDPALLPYAVALLVSLALTVQRCLLWARRPPTAALLRRGLRAAASLRRWPALLPRLTAYLVLHRFVARRGRARWWAHWPIAAGCLLAVGIVIPLVAGWVSFRTPATALNRYVTVVFGHGFPSFATDSLLAFLVFHGLVWAGLLVLLGVAMATRRRLRDRGDGAVQGFWEDALPLLLLGAVTLTGLLLTVSYAWLGGSGHRGLALIHLATVAATLLWLPFGKLLHVPQRLVRVAQVFAADAARQSGMAACARCGATHASAAQIAELEAVEGRLGYRYQIPGGGHWQRVCPRCRRALLVLAQGARCRAAHRAPEPAGVEV